ncbi:MAG: hypothetical protein AMJ60_10980 [Desulfobacterales bacterium SG8_35]|nr:MAG: hypothetical protein AMJ60_10980 [Desulfobacterales bacterium SG8_35]
MKDPADPMDLLNDDGSGTVEMCLLEEEGKHKKDGRNTPSGCCIVLLLLGTSLTIAAWCLSLPA